MKKYINLLLLLLLSFSIIQAQELLTGKVVGANGNPLPDARVSFSDSQHIVYSNDNGLFSLKLNRGKHKIKITLINFSVLDTVIEVPSAMQIFQLLPEAKQLQEVTISTGYQKVGKEKLTGSYQHITAATLNEQVGSNLLTRLEAIGNGLSVDRESYSRERINIRGVSTFSGPGNVLVILDNFPYEGSLENLNPNDVESISILKDAAATSIWGSRAGNGVVVIQSKKGRYNEVLNINANVVSSFKAAPDLYRLPQMNSSDFIDTEMRLFQAGYYANDYNSINKTALTPIVELLYNNAVNQSSKDALINNWRNKDVRDDFKQYLYQNAYAGQYYVQAAAGGKGFGWTASAGYDDGYSELNAKNNRLSLRYALNLEPIKNLKLDIGLLYTGSNSKSGKSAYGTITSGTRRLYPYASFADANGNAVALPKDYSTRYLNSLTGSPLLDWNYYPLNNDDEQVKTTHLDDLNINTGIHYSWKGLTISALYRLQRQTGTGSFLQTINSYNTRNLINSFTQLSQTVTPIYKVPLGAIEDQSNAQLRAEDLRAQVNYRKRFGQHGLDVMAGAEQREQINDGYEFRNYGLNTNVLTITAVDYTTAYPNFVTGSNSFIPDKQGLNHTNNRYLSTYGNFSYDYQEQYLFYGSARRDATNFFGVNTNDKWKPLWSLGLGWVISKAGFYEFKTIDYLKIRASYGYSGNADPNQTGLTTIQYGGTSIYTQSPYANIDKKANPDLKWETVQTTNLGADFNALNGRLYGSVDAYIKRGKDLLGVYPVDYTTGVGTFITKNVAAMRGRGIDVQLNSVNTTGKLKWQSQLNLSSNHTKITDYYLLTTNASEWVGGATASISGIVGSPVYSIYAFKSAGLDATGDPIAYLNGQVSKDYTGIVQNGTALNELKFFGSALPTFFGNIQNRFSYKGFSLQMSISFKLGYYFRRQSINYNSLINSGAGHSDYTDRWQKAGDEVNTTVPAFTYPNNASRDVFYAGSEKLVERGDHIRFQYANLSYKLPDGLLGKGFRAAEFYMNTSNLGIIWKANKKDIDPENAGTTSIAPLKTISAGCRLNF